MNTNTPAAHADSRCVRPDAISDESVYLIKKVRTLRLTQQIVTLSILAEQTQRALVIVVPCDCVLHPSLQSFIDERPDGIDLERRSPL